MPTINLLYKHQYAINENISIVIPTVGEILDNEDNYYNLVSIITAMPIDLMCQLDDLGIDYASINEYELFLLMFACLKTQDTSLIFGDLNLANFEICVNNQNGMMVLHDEKNNITIDRAIHAHIATALRKIHHLEKNIKKPANKEARDYMLGRAKEKLRRRHNKQEVSQIESLIIAMVNTEQFKYDYNSVRDLSIYQFNESVRQIIHKVDYDNRMHGIYAGTISTKDLNQNDLNWLTHK